MFTCARSNILYGNEKLSSGRKSYYVRFRLDDSSWSAAKSSSLTTKTSAEAWAIDNLAH